MIDDTLHDRQRAARLLLRDGWLEHEDHPELMDVIWRARERIAADFFDVLGYRLQIERGMARLRKQPLRVQPYGRVPQVRPEAKGGPTRDWWPPFTYQHYLLLFCLLAELERDPNRAQALISTLAEEVRRAAADAGETVDYTVAAHRRKFCDVLRWLEDRGILAVVDGDRDAFADGDKRAVEALYGIDRIRLDRLSPDVLIADATRDRLRERALATPHSLSEEGRRTRLRLAASRRLAEDPVVYIADLPDEEQAYFRHQRRFLAARIQTLTGLVPEHRAEGTMLVDPSGGEATDMRFPTHQRDRQTALLIGAALAGQHGESPFTPADVRDAASGLLVAHPRYFTKTGDVMAREAIEQLTGADLMIAESNVLRLRPAFGRYRDAIALPQSVDPQPQGSLL